MASHSRSTSVAGGNYGASSGTGSREKTHFEMQREALIGEIAMVSLLSFLHFFSFNSLCVLVSYHLSLLFWHYLRNWHLRANMRIHLIVNIPTIKKERRALSYNSCEI